MSDGSSNNTRRERSQEPIRPQMKLNSRGERKSARSNQPLASLRGPPLRRGALEEPGKILIHHGQELAGRAPTKRVGSRIQGYLTTNL